MVYISGGGGDDQYLTQDIKLEHQEYLETFMLGLKMFSWDMRCTASQIFNSSIAQAPTAHQVGPLREQSGRINES